VTQAVDQVSVIICAYTEKRLDDLIAAVESVQKQTCPPSEIIVVIDHNPSLLRQVQEYFSDVVVVENIEVRGLSGARNSGVAIAKSPLIAFLDDDAIAAPDWLQSLVTAFADPQVLGVGGAVIPCWLDKQPSWFPAEFHWVVGCTYRGMPQTGNSVRNPIGTNMAFRRETFDGVGFFLSEFGRVGTYPAGCEETEFCIRARQHWPQGRFLYKPEACVFHRIPSNRMTWRYFCARCYAEGLSKAFVMRRVGIVDGLASERIYIKTLPRAIWQGFVETFITHDLSGMTRSAAIIGGFIMTASGYLVSTLLHTTGLKSMTPSQRHTTHHYTNENGDRCSDHEVSSYPSLGETDSSLNEKQVLNQKSCLVRGL
jgi:GT2 family glycosyltransferase